MPLCGLRTGNYKSMLENLTYFIFIKIIHSWITILIKSWDLVNDAGVDINLLPVLHFNKNIDRIVG